MSGVGPVGCDGSRAVGLRERKKIATRRALGEAALRLALERGFGNVRVGDIADAAGVSTRTYNNYFSSREEAICALGAERARRVVARLRERPGSEPLGDALLQAIATPAAHVEPDKATLRLIVCDPALRGEHLKALTEIERPLAEAIAERVGLDVDRDVGPLVLAAACEGAVRAAALHWLHSDGAPTLYALLQEALQMLAPAADALDARGHRRAGRSAVSRTPEEANPCS